MKVVLGWNQEPTLRFGVRKVAVGPRHFWAIGLWPLLIGIGRVPRPRSAPR